MKPVLFNLKNDAALNFEKYPAVKDHRNSYQLTLLSFQSTFVFAGQSLYIELDNSTSAVFLYLDQCNLDL